MGLTTSISCYLVIWWTVLFAVLPLGSRSYHDAGIKVTDGGDPGAPVNPNLKRKFITTTWVAAICFALLWCVITFHLVHLPTIPSGG
jgi:predicted secreted protein